MSLPASVLAWLVMLIAAEGFWDWLGNAGTALAVVTAALALLGGARALYKRTLGRRRDLYRRLARLGARAQLSFFADVLGESPAMRWQFAGKVSEYNSTRQGMVEVERLFIECFFIDRDYYVQVVCDLDETVLAFSVTTRSQRFKPSFSFPPRPGFQQRRRWREITGRRFKPAFRVTLGRTRFDEVMLDRTWSRPARRMTRGARVFAYTEVYYLGNPGYYQHYGFTASSAVQAQVGPVGKVADEVGYEWHDQLGSEESVSGEYSEALRRFRRETVVTTYTVLGPHLSPENYPTQFGPHGDEVRVLP